MPVEGEASLAQYEQAKTKADEILDAHGGTTYALFTRLQLAKLAVESNQLGQAREQLQAALDANPDGKIEPLVRLRLAKVVFAESGA